MKKTWKTAMVAAVMMTAVVLPVYAGTWGNDEKGSWYQNDSGSYARSQIMNIDGVNYGFDGQAYMVKGWYNENSKWYYFDPTTGAQATGWTKVGETWYYMDAADNGAMHTSWLKLGNNRYYMDESGAMKVGDFAVGGFRYFAEADGNLRRNKIDTEGGISIKYDDEGREYYKNDESKANSQAGGELWLPLLESSALADQRQEVQASNADYVEEVKDDLYTEYQEKVQTATTTKSRTSKLTKWESKVNRVLGGLYVTQADINDYITNVKIGNYGNDSSDNGYYDDEYDYDSEYDYDDSYYDD